MLPCLPGDVAADCPLMAGAQARMAAPEALLRVLKPPPIRRPRRGRPPSSRLPLGDPSRVDFRLASYPLVTPLRRDDQGLLSDEASGFPLLAGGQACVPAPEVLLRVLKPAASPLRNPRSCRRMTGGGVPASICRPWRGRPRSSRLPLGDPSRVDFRLVFYPLVTPLRRADQGLPSDEASGFTSCVACDRHFFISNGSWGHAYGVFFISNRRIGTCSWCTVHTITLAVGSFIGQGCERSELPCLAHSIDS